MDDPALFLKLGAALLLLLGAARGLGGTAVNLLFGELILGCLWAGRRAVPGPGR